LGRIILLGLILFFIKVRVFSLAIFGPAIFSL